MAAKPLGPSIRLDHYALYLEELALLQLHKKWTELERIVATAIDAHEQLMRLSDIVVHKPESVPEKMLRTMVAEHENVITSSWSAIASILDSLPPTDERKPYLKDDPVTWMGQTFLVGGLFLAEHKTKSSHAILLYWRFHLSCTRHSCIESAVKDIRARHAARHSMSPLDGGRPCDVGLWTLLAEAADDGMSIRDLAEVLVEKDLDPNQTGSTAKRITREAKRLAEAKRTMAKRQHRPPKEFNHYAALIEQIEQAAGPALLIELANLETMTRLYRPGGVLAQDHAGCQANSIKKIREQIYAPKPPTGSPTAK